jgi:hypothetical protein
MIRMRVKKWMWWVLGAVIALQIYFVRELFAAELLFAIIFATLLLFVFAFYLVKKAGERGVTLAESWVHVASPAFRRGFHYLEEASRKPFRRARSESAQ